MKESHLILLANCMNGLNLLMEPIEANDLPAFFDCIRSQPLRIARNKNRLMVYLLWQLESRGLITMEWQAVCGKEKLLASHTGSVLSRNNLSSILYQAKETPPKHSEIIDNCVKQLKKA